MRIFSLLQDMESNRLFSLALSDINNGSLESISYVQTCLDSFIFGELNEFLMVLRNIITRNISIQLNYLTQSLAEHRGVKFYDVLPSSTKNICEKLSFYLNNLSELKE